MAQTKPGPSMLRLPARYIAVYNGADLVTGGNNGEIGVATGSDPRFLGRRGIISPTADQTTTWGNESGKRNPTIIKDEHTIKLYYEGYDSTRWQIFFEEYDAEMNLRYAHAVPIIKYTDIASATSVERPSVLYDPEDVEWPYKMALCVATSGINGTSLRLARSKDGVNWSHMGEAWGLGSGWESTYLSTTGRILKKDGLYYLFYSGNSGAPTAGWRSGVATNSTWATAGWTKNPNNPLIQPRGQGKQQLAATISAGDKTVTVADTANYDVGAPIVVWYEVTNAYEFNVIAEKVNSTTLRVRYAFQGAYTWNDGVNGPCYICQIHSGSVDISEVWFEDGLWKCLFTAFQFIPDYGLESCGYAETSDLDAGFTIDPTIWPIPMSNKVDAFDRSSAENIHFVRVL